MIIRRLPIKRPYSPVECAQADVPSSSKSRTPGLTSKVTVSARASEERTAILESSITLIKRAALSPGGDNFRLAVQKLNHYFEGTSPSQYLLESASENS